jgi:hypothetical protein
MVSPPRVRRFSFDEDMDRIWAQCCDLVVSHQKVTNCAATLVKPWHLALLLLFGDLSKESDLRLYTDEPLLSVSQTLEMPLFWTAISRVSSIHNRLDEHISSSVGRVKDARYLQQLIGQAFWKKVEEESVNAEPATYSGDENVSGLSVLGRDMLTSRIRSWIGSCSQLCYEECRGCLGVREKDIRRLCS